MHQRNLRYGNLLAERVGTYSKFSLQFCRPVLNSCSLHANYMYMYILIGICNLFDLIKTLNCIIRVAKLDGVYV